MIGGGIPIVASQERGRGEDRGAFAAFRRRAGAVVVNELRPASLEIDARSPGHLGDERSGRDEVAVSAVIYVEEPVLVEMSGGLHRIAVLLHVEGHDCGHRIVVPAIVWSILVMPFDLAAVGVDGNRGSRIQ